MTRIGHALVTLTACAAVGSGGYWVGTHNSIFSVPTIVQAVTSASAQVPTGPVIYYQDPEGKPAYASEPKKTLDGRPYRPVHASEDLSFDTPRETTAASAAQAKKRVLYYRNPMGLPDVSPAPKKDAMGMDYIPVYDVDEDEGSAVKIAPGKQQLLGVKSEPVTRRVIAQPVRAPGTIQLDERRIAVISLRSEAFIDTVSNITTGSMVRKGQALMRVYSPAIASAAAEYLATIDTKLNAELPRGARQRLMNQNVPPELLAEIVRTREIPLTFTWSAPRDGVILERNVADGMRVMPGDVLFRLADTSVVWALVDVSERDLADVAEGQPVAVRVRSFPNRIFAGTVALVYPQLNAATRTVRVRVELPNTDFLLRPGMYADAEIGTDSGQDVIAVPDSAVIDSGDRQVVIIDKGNGRFEPRPVQLGSRGAGYVEIREGVSEGETVVTSANFLIDAESNLKSALKDFAAGAAQ